MGTCVILHRYGAGFWQRIQTTFFFSSGSGFWTGSAAFSAALGEPSGFKLLLAKLVCLQSTEQIGTLVILHVYGDGLLQITQGG
jgi:hypothetical protein